MTKVLLITILLIGLNSTHTLAEQKGQTLQIATRVVDPFVFQDGTNLSGFSIDLWREIAAKLGLKYQFKQYSDSDKLLNAVEQHQADLGISTITITAEREQRFDFSYPIFENGLQIMIRSLEGSTSASNPIENLLSFGRSLFATIIPKLLNFGAIFLGVGAFLSLIIAHLVWLFERGHEDKFFSDKYIPGIFQAFWWALTNLFGQQEHPKKSLSRVVSFFWVFTTVLMLAYFTASLTSDLTVAQINGDIRGLDDLKGRLVATTTNSAPATFLKERHIKPLEFSSIDQMYQALLLKKVDAVVFDAPILKYYSTHEGDGKVQLVGEVFDQTNYGIAFPQKSSIRKDVNVALLKLDENGVYKKLYDKYFKEK